MSKYMLYVLFLHMYNTVECSTEPCKKLIASGYGPFQGVYNIVPGRIMHEKSYWKHEIQDLYIRNLKQGDRHYWLFTSFNVYGTWQGYNHGDAAQKSPDESPDSFRVYSTNLQIQHRFKCADYLVTVPQYLLHFQLYCDQYIIQSVIKPNAPLEVKLEDCIKDCEALSACEAVTVWYDGCYQHSKTCLKSGTDPKLGSYHYSKEKSTLALYKPTEQSSTDWKGLSKLAVDGNYGSNPLTQQTCSHTMKEVQPWWAVDLVYKYIVTGVLLKSRTDCCIEQLAGAVVALGRTGTLQEDLNKLQNRSFDSITDFCGKVPESFDALAKQAVGCTGTGKNTNYVIVYLNNTQPMSLTICEIEVFYLTPNRFTLMEKRLTKSSGEKYCSDVYHGQGRLALVKDESVLKYIRKSLLSFGKDVMWTGQNVSSADMYFDYWFPNVTKRLLNIGGFSTTTCSSSTSENRYSCNVLMDGSLDPQTSQWLLSGHYMSAWVKVQFVYEYYLQEIHILQAFCSCRSMKDVKLTFSDSSTMQFSLQQRKGMDDTDESGKYWDTLSIEGKSSDSVTVEITSVHDTYKSAGGFVEIIFIAEEKAGFKISGGECLHNTLNTIYTDVLGCQIECRKNSNCKGFVHFFKGNNMNECQMKSKCERGDLTTNYEALAFIYTESSKEGSFSLRSGYSTNCILGTFSGMPSMEICSLISLQVFAAATGYAWHSDQTSSNAGQCIILCNKDTAGEESSGNKDWYFAMKIGIMEIDRAKNSIGCYTNWPSSIVPTNYPSLVTAPDGTTSFQNCQSKCENYTYTGLQQGKCVCRDAFGTPQQGCNTFCDSGFGICGKLPDMYNVYTTDVSEISNACIQLSTKLQGTHEHYLPWIQNEDHGVLKMQKNFCDTEYPVLCENTDFDHCYSSPCQNGVSCTTTDLSYNCECIPGYTGYMCETDINECMSYSCESGGTCTDHINSYTCTCVLGYTGNNCETNIDECDSAPCLHNSVCVDEVNGFNCNCIDGYTGTTCETNLNECQSNPCRNGGVCQDQINNFQCICKPGYAGVLCERNINECTVDGVERCHNGGTCIDLLNDFQCHCNKGFTGKQCETDINECESYPCQNGGSCKDLVARYVCYCLEGFNGPYCENNINECWSGPCRNNAPCIDKVSKYECQCLAGFSGTNCEEYTGNPGNWGSWNQWSECTALCDQGLKHRTRECIPLFPELGGGVCSGSDSDSVTCVAKPCGPVNGNWGPWIEENECSSKCGPGRVRVSRLCDTPMPSNGGSNCTGISERWQLCEVKPCLVYTKCADWSSWSDCVGSCDASESSKYRWCFPQDFQDDIYIQENIEYTDPMTNISFSIKEEVRQNCVREGCGKKELQCSVCESSFLETAGKVSNCVSESHCSRTEDVCLASYSLENGNIHIRKRCGSTQECTSSKGTDICGRLKALAMIGDLKINNMAVSSQLWSSVLTLWRHLGEVTCTLCCTGHNCNKDIIPGMTILA